MPEQTMVLIALLLTAAVMYGYFYFKKAQTRTPRSGASPAHTDSDHTESTREG